MEKINLKKIPYFSSYDIASFGESDKVSKN